MYILIYIGKKNYIVLRFKLIVYFKNIDKKVHQPNDIAGGHKIFPADNECHTGEDIELKLSKIESEKPRIQESLGSIEGLQVIKLLLTCQKLAIRSISFTRMY